MEREIMTVKQVAGYLQVNERTIYRMAQNGEIPCFKVRDAWRFKKDKIDQWIEEYDNNSKKIK